MSQREPRIIIRKRALRKSFNHQALIPFRPKDRQDTIASNVDHVAEISTTGRRAVEK
jgi:hypothetical protein